MTVATGGLLPVAVVVRWAALRAIDADIGVRRDRIVLLRRVGMFRLLPVPIIEGLALRLGRLRVPAQTDVFRKGDPADGFYVIESGRVVVIDDGQRSAGWAPATPSARSHCSVRSSGQQPSAPSRTPNSPPSAGTSSCRRSPASPRRPTPPSSSSVVTSRRTGDGTRTRRDRTPTAGEVLPDGRSPLSPINPEGP
jgi:hypothetical protein